MSNMISIKLKYSYQTEIGNIFWNNLRTIMSAMSNLLGLYPNFDIKMP